jgi:hypothetical protein
MFPRAYMLALVVNDVAYEQPTVSLFGWRDASLELRDYHLLDPESGASARGSAHDDC